jgi:hypothetical protein
VDDLKKLFEEPGCLECELPVVFVDIEHAPLCSRIRGGFRFVDHRCNTVNMEDPGTTGVFILIPSWLQAAARNFTDSHSTS